MRITDEWLEQNPSYTCGCGLYVHPSKRNPTAIHITGCQFDAASKPMTLADKLAALLAWVTSRFW